MTTPTTLGDFLVAVAYGSESRHVVSEKDSELALRELSRAVAPHIEEVRSEQRKVFDDSKSLMVF